MCGLELEQLLHIVARNMFRTKSIPPPIYEQDATIIMSSLSPTQSLPSLSFEDMHQIRYKELRADLKKVLSPKKPNLTPTPMKIKHERKPVLHNKVPTEPCLYQPPVSREFALSPNRRSVSPSELILLRAQHVQRMNQVEIHATPITKKST